MKTLEAVVSANGKTSLTTLSLPKNAKKKKKKKKKVVIPNKRNMQVSIFMMIEKEYYQTV